MEIGFQKTQSDTEEKTIYFYFYHDGKKYGGCVKIDKADYLQKEKTEEIVNKWVDAAIEKIAEFNNYAKED